MSDMDWQPADEQHRTDVNTAGRWDEYDHFIAGRTVTHTRTKYTDPVNHTTGPDYCYECTEAWQSWVRWPCDGS